MKILIILGIVVIWITVQFLVTISIVQLVAQCQADVLPVVAYDDAKHLIRDGDLVFYNWKDHVTDLFPVLLIKNTHCHANIVRMHNNTPEMVELDEKYNHFQWGNLKNRFDTYSDACYWLRLESCALPTNFNKTIHFVLANVGYPIRAHSFRSLTERTKDSQLAPFVNNKHDRRHQKPNHTTPKSKASLFCFEVMVVILIALQILDREIISPENYTNLFHSNNLYNIIRSNKYTLSPFQYASQAIRIQF